MSFYCVLSLMGYFKDRSSGKREMDSHVRNVNEGPEGRGGKERVGQRVEDGKKSSKGASGSHAPASKAQLLPNPAVCSHKLLAFCYPAAASYWLDLEDKLEAFSAQGRYGESWVTDSALTEA